LPVIVAVLSIHFESIDPYGEVKLDMGSRLDLTSASGCADSTHPP
jgi:hypothetical protein